MAAGGGKSLPIGTSQTTQNNGGLSGGPYKPNSGVTTSPNNKPKMPMYKSHNGDSDMGDKDYDD